MKILFLPQYEGAETSERTPSLIHILKKRHELIFLKAEENFTRKRASWPLRAWERLNLTRSLITRGKKLTGIDLIFARDTMNALPGCFIARHLGRPIVWDSEGSLKAFWDSTHKYPAQILPWLPVEKWLTKKITRMTTVTESDREAYVRQGMDPKKIDLIPVCIRTEKRSTKTKKEARQTLGLPPDQTLFLFFSQFNYPPNQRALQFLNEEAVPKFPGTLLLCGRGRLPKKLHPKIRYLGFVPLATLYDLIRAVDIGLSPVWEANGSLTKVLDMLAHGAPTVITRAVQKGIPEIVDRLHAVVAEGREDFIEKTLTLAHHRSLQETLQAHAPQIILQRYDWRLYEEKLFALLESLVQT